MTVKDNVVGKYAKADLAVGDYILAAKISEAPAAENAYLYNLDGTCLLYTSRHCNPDLFSDLIYGGVVSTCNF